MTGMPTLNPSQALLIGFIVAPILFALSAFLTHATRRHILAALIGAALYAAVNFAWDRLAAGYGWWSYPAWSATGQFPWIGYAMAGLVGGGACGLVGWRIFQRWRWKGFALFLLFWAAYALVHDYGGSLLFASSRLMVFAPGPVPLVADVLWYITGNAVSPVLITIMTGGLPASSRS